MSLTKSATGLQVQRWDANFFKEYVQESAFASEYGTTENAIIQLKNFTTGKGKSITFSLVNRLVGAGVTGSSTLEGNEEDLYSRSHEVIVDKIRNGVLVPEIEEKYSAIPLRNAAKAVLKTWIMEQTRDDIIAALHSIHTGSAQVGYAAASSGQLNTWIGDNNDRVLFGDDIANYQTDNYATSLAQIAAGDTMSTSILSLAKRMALRANPKIRPVMVKGGGRFYKVYLNNYQMRDLKADTAFQAANREARMRGKDNPLFGDSDYIWDGMIISEVDDMPAAVAAGAASAPVAPAFLCGAQAVGIGWGKKTTSKEELFDYGDKQGCAIEEIRGIEKLHFGTQKTSPQAVGDDTADVKQNGVVTIWTSSPAD